MTNSLMPHTKTWTSDEGVQIEMVTYRTVLVDRVREQLAAFINDDGSMPSSLSTFILCVAHTVKISLPEIGVPIWAAYLEMVYNDPKRTKEIGALYQSLDFYPSDVMVYWWKAYEATRDTALNAAPELQQTSPLPVEAYEEAGEEDEGKLNFTESSTASGGPSLTVMSSPSLSKASAGRTRKAT